MTQAAQRTFLITGASQGAGRALSRRLVSAGHRVVDLARGVADFPGGLGTVDLADHVATYTLLQERTRRFAFDGVVNNVGLVKLQRIGRVELDGTYTLCLSAFTARTAFASVSLMSTADAQAPIRQRAWSSQVHRLFTVFLCVYGLWIRIMHSSIPQFYGMLASTFSGGPQTSAERTVWSTFLGPGNKGLVKDATPHPVFTDIPLRRSKMSRPKKTNASNRRWPKTYTHPAGISRPCNTDYCGLS